MKGSTKVAQFMNIAPFGWENRGKGGHVGAFCPTERHVLLEWIRVVQAHTRGKCRCEKKMLGRERRYNVLTESSKRL